MTSPAKPPVHHIRKAHFKGSETNVEAWRRGTIPPHLTCTGCGKKGCAIWIRTYYPMQDFLRIFGPGQALLHAAKFEGKLPIYPTIFGEFVFTAEIAACNQCAPAAEKAAAHHPSWALVEVRKGPELMKPTIQVVG
jgi:hypothetical protein